MTPTLSQWICPAYVNLFRFIPTPWICATICEVVNGKLRCPKCGLERQIALD